MLDTLPLRTVTCQCPSDTFTDTSGRCKAISYETPECRTDLDCSDADKCVRGACIGACRIDKCGINAICDSVGHRGVCSCAPGYVGNPYVECSPGNIIYDLSRACMLNYLFIFQNLNCHLLLYPFWNATLMMIALMTNHAGMNSVLILVSETPHVQLMLSVQ